jgi:hypothetical protein
MRTGRLTGPHIILTGALPQIRLSATTRNTRQRRRGRACLVASWRSSSTRISIRVHFGKCPALRAFNEICVDRRNQRRWIACPIPPLVSEIRTNEVRNSRRFAAYRDQAEGTTSSGKYDSTRATTSETAISRPSCTSQMDTMGKNFVKSMYKNMKVAPNPMVMATSTHVGE